MKLRLFLALLLGTVAYVSAQNPGPGSSAAQRPDVTRFEVEHVVPEGELNEPMVFAVAADGRAYIGERHGAMKVFNPATALTKTITTFQVFDQNEQGFIGLSLDPGFASNRWVYVVYSAAEASEFRLVRLTLTADDDIVSGSARTVLTIPVDRAGTNHTGGGMTWDARGHLYLTVGNNTGNSQFMQSDERPGRQMADDQRGAANSNDLRGKILRIHPEPDGTYTIPAGNLFPPGTPNARPEIYTMGHRNVWRVSVDSATGYVYWGEVGPDQAADTPTAPRGYDEFNRATRPGFFGWPYFVGNNAAAAVRGLCEQHVRRVQGSAAAGQFVDEQHRHPRAAAGTARDDLLSVRDLRSLPRTRQRRAVCGRRTRLSARGLLCQRRQTLAGVLRGQVADHRLHARVGEVGDDGGHRRGTPHRRRRTRTCVSPNRWTSSSDTMATSTCSTTVRSGTRRVPTRNWSASSTRPATGRRWLSRRPVPAAARHRST